jgi:hypothetical protein
LTNLPEEAKHILRLKNPRQYIWLMPSAIFDLRPVGKTIYRL